MKKILILCLTVLLVGGLGMAVSAQDVSYATSKQPKSVQCEMSAFRKHLVGETRKAVQTGLSQKQTPQAAWHSEALSRPYFVGNSLFVGVQGAAGDDAQFCCKTGVMLPELNQMLTTEGDYDCVFVCMGTNELGGFDRETFLQEYARLIERFDVPVFCVSVPPVNEAKVWARGYAKRVCNTNVQTTNAWIQAFCEDRGYEYLDCVGFFGIDLAGDMTGDGLHLTPDGYEAWYQWLLTEAGIVL